MVDGDAPRLGAVLGKTRRTDLREGAGDVAMRAGLRPMVKAVDRPPDSNVGAPALYPTIELGEIVRFRAQPGLATA
jgi:hypothetical protein